MRPGRTLAAVTARRFGQISCGWNHSLDHVQLYLPLYLKWLWIVTSELFSKLNLTFAAGLLVVLDVLIVDGPLDFFGGRRVDVVFRLSRHFVDETDSSRTNDLFDFLKDGGQPR